MARIKVEILLAPVTIYQHAARFAQGYVPAHNARFAVVRTGADAPWEFVHRRSGARVGSLLPALTTPAALTLWGLLKGPTAEERATEALRERVQALQFANIPGFFPTPAEIVARMIEAADIQAGAAVLEPSAGSGAILDELEKAAPGCRLVVYERHNSLREILSAKGFPLAGDDFTESDMSLRVARVLMNPPFENGQDMAHVRRAFDHLEPGGRLVAVMSPGPFFRQDAKAQAFREWFEARGGEREEIPAGAFKASGTGVAAVLVTIERGAK